MRKAYPFSLLVFVSLWGCHPSTAGELTTTSPEPVSDPRWIRLFADQKRQLGTKVDLCFVGDSLTEFWGETGKPILRLEFPEQRIANLGIAADRTEHILFRIHQLDFSRANPRAFIVLAGTNNLAKDPPDSPSDTVAGVRAIVKTIQRKAAGSRILLLSILPNGYEPISLLRKRILDTNDLLAEIPGVEFLDIHDRFVEVDGRWKSGLTLDGTHLSLQGYDLLGRLISAQLR